MSIDARARAAQDAAARISSIFLQQLAARSAVFGDFVGAVRSAKGTVVLRNLEGSALALVVAALRSETRQPIVVLTAGMERAESLYDDFAFFGIEEACHFPKWEVLPYDDEDLSLEVTSKHLDAFELLARARKESKAPPPLITAPVDALMQKVVPAEELEKRTIRLEWGERVDLEKLVVDLDAAGYERVGLVESRGEFSIRGSIVDIYPPNTSDPVRLDLFGDEIESIRTFDLVTQRSLDDWGTETPLAIHAVRLKHHYEDHIRSGAKLVSLFDLLPKGTLFVLDAPERYEEVCTYFESAVERQHDQVLHKESDLGPPGGLILSKDELLAELEKFRRIEHSRLPPPPEEGGVRVFTFQTGGFSVTDGDLASWIGAIKRRQHEDYLVMITCDNEGQAQRFEEVLHEQSISARLLLEEDAASAFRMRSVGEGYQDVLLVVGGVQDGFLFHDARLALITDREVFGRYKRRHTYKKIYKGRPIASSNDIQRGDYVVHVEHGVAKYLGMRQQQMDGRTVDLLELAYADGAKLLVPVEKIRFVQKYQSGDAEGVTLDRLGSTRWAKRRAKSREQIEQMAEELIKLYARREIARRDPFGPDTRMQTQFESSFPYQETPDQLRAIMEVKRDMERHRPMDRLVCGDVGYGKTEVAIRAVFKAVEEGRQAAVLVPTTILALQHFRSFAERYADYPLRVELMSRFQSAKEVRETKARLKSGETHVVVGTHKLLGKDVVFKDLGLLVIDEEQRFGVKAKERLKELRAEVDILTMTATPIPRTLHMAMSGLRDFSLISTPPPDRYPIKTKLIHWEEELIAEAVLRELNRGGQVFFVHNRIHNIQQIAEQLQKIVPHARIGVAHGQMKESELEDHMIEFVKGGYDILVSTTIVESGIDIPNANTILINRADAFGLAQLYQLRGRVGREKRRAYAYLIVPQGQAITDSAVRRLAAIEEFTELGSGFNIAMRDMEIRGAGNMLGKEQHGLVMEIGFELYCDMLQDAVAHLKGDAVHDQHDVEVKWPVSSYIPAPYIPVETQRVNFYKRLATMRMQEDVEDLRNELRDRFGELPPPVETLLRVTSVRLAAARLRATLVDGSASRVRLNLAVAPEGDLRAALAVAVAETDGIASATADGALTILIQLEPGEEAERLDRAARFLRRLQEELAGKPDPAPASTAGA